MSRRALLALAIGLAVAACAGPRPTPPPSATLPPPPLVTPGPGDVPSANPSHGPTAPPGSISSDQAIAAAKAAAPGAGTGATALSASVGDNPFSPGSLAWLVRLQGLPAPACPNADTAVPTPEKAGASGAPCLDGEGGVWAVVDPVTGALVGWAY